MATTAKNFFSQFFPSTVNFEWDSGMGQWSDYSKSMMTAPMELGTTKLITRGAGGAVVFFVNGTTGINVDGVPCTNVIFAFIGNQLGMVTAPAEIEDMWVEICDPDGAIATDDAGAIFKAFYTRVTGINI